MTLIRNGHEENDEWLVFGVFSHYFPFFNRSTDRIGRIVTLSLAWCWLMQKSNSIGGSLLFHAAMDIAIFVGIFSDLSTGLAVP